MDEWSGYGGRRNAREQMETRFKEKRVTGNVCRSKVRKWKTEKGMVVRD